MIRYAKPRDVDEALALLGEARWKILAGGTDFYPALGNRPLSENVLDINALDALRGISETETHLVIGARTTWTDIAKHELPPAFDMLKQAAREIGSPQIQNVATISGNLCNASPAADGVPPLMALDVEVELRSLAGSRVLRLSDFILGNRRIACRPDEMVTAVLVPKASLRGTSSFRKLGARRYLVISIAMAAARMVTDAQGKIETAAIAVGACSAVARRLSNLESSLIGLRSAAEIEHAVMAASLDELSPIDDVRGTATYRHAAAREIVARAILGALGLSEAEAAA
ncbi:MAG: xanthine dehydrogenase family protein subunit M [Mesorhizobium sp.]|nr:xanthine dehydrogenase family protein subunit M [Mesorhizobium sp.]MBL8576909.1 xanthine dehydrogenase family protein subunit M [Mesorhizobium sp.]